MAEALQLFYTAAQLLELTRGHRGLDRSRGEQVAVDPVVADRRLDRFEVLEPQPLKSLDLLGEARHAVADPVDQRRRHEAAVTAAGADRDRVPLDQRDRRQRP